MKQTCAGILVGLLCLTATASAETITKQEWAKRVDGVCAYFNTRYPPDPPQLWATQMAYYAKHGTAYVKLSNRFTKQVEAIPLPKTGKTLAETWLRLNAQQSVWDKKQVAAAWRHDMSAFQTAWNRSLDRYDARKPIARALGMKVCTR